MTTLTKLRALYDAATQGWHRESYWQEIFDAENQLVATMSDCTVHDRISAANAALIVAMHAALPKLLKVAEAAERLIDSNCIDAVYNGERFCDVCGSLVMSKEHLSSCDIGKLESALAELEE